MVSKLIAIFYRTDFKKARLRKGFFRVAKVVGGSIMFYWPRSSQELVRAAD